MALNLSNLTPTPSTVIPKRTVNRDAGPNPFLDEGWLLTSFETEESQDFPRLAWYDLPPLEGTEEIYTIEKGKNKGQTAKRYTGDVKTVLNMLRDAARKLGIGVSIDVSPATYKNGKPIPGQMVVKYLGTVRKVYKTAGTETEAETDGTDTEE